MLTMPADGRVAEPFRLRGAFRDPVRRALLHVLGKPLEHTLGLSELNRHYAAAEAAEGEREFLQALDVCHVTYRMDEGALARIPKSGPLVIVSNHPFGGLDGVVLAAILRKVRPDTKVMANFLLARVPEFRELMIFVDPFGGKDALNNNRGAIREALRHVKDGHPLIIFPAGEVSHLDLKRRAIMDPEWSDTVARIVRRNEAPVLPVFFHGNNSKLFNLMGLVHPMFRTALLPREFLSKRRSCVAVEIGTTIPFGKLADFKTDEEMTAYLRLRSYILQTRRSDITVEKTNRAPVTQQAAIAAAGDPGLILDEVMALPAEAIISDSESFTIYACEAEKIPQALFEIGRLREITFRGANEGTGKPLDLDEFDPDYVHLFCWSKAKREIVGAYRLGPTDVILPAKGVAGLYTRTLFRYDGELLEKLGPALEVGRSFIRPEYQKSYAPLLLLWKGIGGYVARNPRYQVLFGPVSINNMYQSFSRKLIMAFLRATSSSHLAGLIRAKNPPRIGPLRESYMQEYSTVVRNIDQVSDLVQEIEADRKGIPILLKQYMRLSARILGFNVDPAFGDVLDGLILVDLRQTEKKLVEKFCGKEGTAAIAAHRAEHKLSYD